MKKTETIKKRRVDVYLKTENQKRRWNAFAHSKKTSLSKLMILAMEGMINDSMPNRQEELIRTQEENEKMRKELDELRQRSNRLDKYVEVIETDLKKARTIKYNEPGPGIRSMNRDLMRLLRKSKEPLSHQEMLKALDIAPSDTDLIQSLSIQLESLVDYGIVKYTGRGWFWNE